jgi:hypothetical protein
VTIIYCLRFETSLFVASYDSRGHGGGIRPRLPTGVLFLSSQSQSYVPTDGQSASLSWNKAPTWGLRPDFYFCQAVAGLPTWGALSDERTGPSLTSAAGPRQRSHSRTQTPRDPRPHLTVSDSKTPRRPPRHVELRWRCSTPPPHGNSKQQTLSQ